MARITAQLVRDDGTIIADTDSTMSTDEQAITWAKSQQDIGQADWLVIDPDLDATHEYFIESDARGQQVFRSLHQP